ncbi:Arc family DNA-binding protein [Pseudomonas chlororaphis]|uniref:Arc family DNA-binding protein n=1 Tax=Pseudomonas chlororaphis TaxID=587753 RepID=UPI0009C05E94|nr:Arc family DNA-binding protein [Pseudomonas chlororaphis]
MKALKITTAVRMLYEMREKLEMRAAENGRSLSGEIVFRLRKSLEQEMEHEKQQA